MDTKTVILNLKHKVIYCHVKIGILILNSFGVMLGRVLFVIDHINKSIVRFEIVCPIDAAVV